MLKPLISYLAFLFPHVCILCQQKSHTTQDLCVDCWADLPFYPEASCQQCAAVLSHAKATSRCGQCLQKPPPFTSTYSLFHYQTPITKLLMELKFHGRLVNARILGELMAQAIQRRYYSKSLPDLIIPVPLHHQRLKERGFNQTLELARPITALLQVPLLIQECERKLNTQAQAQLKASERKKALKNAFRVNYNLSGKAVAIIDDIITTGRTISEFSWACKKAGADRIDIWTCAKALLGT